VDKFNQLAKQSDTETTTKNKTEPKEIITEGVTPVHDKGGGYVEFENRLFQRNALKELRPDLFSVKVDNTGNYKVSSNFGTTFPKIAAKGDIFVRVDINPNRVYKFDGYKWIEINKESSQSYLYDQEYIKFLIEKIGSGEYDLDSFSDAEKAEIEVYLKGTQNT
jgi:hypothetical protein